MGFEIASKLYKQVAKDVIQKHDAGEFWNWLCNNKGGIAKAIIRSRDLDKIGELITCQEAEFIAHTKKKRAQSQSFGKGQGKANSNEDKRDSKGNGKGGKASSVRAGPSPKRTGGAGMDRQQMLAAEAHIYIPSINAFKYEDGTTAHRIDFESHDIDSTGVIFGQVNTHAREILNMNGDHAPNAQAFVLFGPEVDAFVKDKKFHFYKTEIITVPAARAKGEKISEKKLCWSMLVQLILFTILLWQKLPYQQVQL
jgi:hypothetical protein